MRQVERPRDVLRSSTIGCALASDLPDRMLASDGFRKRIRAMFFKRPNGSVTPERSVLFVCLGNICRSPTAAGVFRTAADRAGIGRQIRVEYAGLGPQHIGLPPDRRAIEAARRRGYDLSAMRGRQVGIADFSSFGWILAMDDSNMSVLTAMSPPEFAGHLGLLLDFAPELGIRDVPDPYYGGPEGFERVLDLIEVSTARLLTRLQATLAGG